MYTCGWLVVSRKYENEHDRESNKYNIEILTPIKYKCTCAVLRTVNIAK